MFRPVVLLKMGVVKDERDIVYNSMPEDEINQNSSCAPVEKKARWGPSHAGAKELASGYTFGKNQLVMKRSLFYEKVDFSLIISSFVIIKA